MAAAEGNTNAAGPHVGKSFNDRKLAAKVRTLALTEMADLLSMPKVKMKADDYDLYKAILIKLAGTVLPRLNEHTGEDGDPAITISILNKATQNDIQPNNSTPQDTAAQETPENNPGGIIGG